MCVSFATNRSKGKFSEQFRHSFEFNGTHSYDLHVNQRDLQHKHRVDHMNEWRGGQLSTAIKLSILITLIRRILRNKIYLLWNVSAVKICKKELLPVKCEMRTKPCISDDLVCVKCWIVVAFLSALLFSAKAIAQSFTEMRRLKIGSSRWLSKGTNCDLQVSAN